MMPRWNAGRAGNDRQYADVLYAGGKPEDIQVIQRYYQEDYWLEGLAAHKTDVVWQYPYDRPHNYLITDFEAYLDVYRATGDKRYLDAMKGAWDLYHDHWEHIGGSIAITELGSFRRGRTSWMRSFRFARQERRAAACSGRASISVFN